MIDFVFGLVFGFFALSLAYFIASASTGYWPHLDLVRRLARARRCDSWDRLQSMTQVWLDDERPSWETVEAFERDVELVLRGGETRDEWPLSRMPLRAGIWSQTERRSLERRYMEPFKLDSKVEHERKIQHRKDLHEAQSRPVCGSCGETITAGDHVPGGKHWCGGKIIDGTDEDGDDYVTK